MKNARIKDIFRTIKKEKKRFFSILLITALGVTMLTGLKAACNDLRYSADALYDEQHLFDIQISSTLGLDDNDITALQELEDVSGVEAEYSKNVYTNIKGSGEEAKIRTMGEKINLPKVVTGRLPEASDEIAVNQTYLRDTGKKVGDTLTFSENDLDDEEEAVFLDTEYTITAEVLDPFDVNNKEGSVSFRAATASDYTFFVPSEAADADIYTSVYVTVKGADQLLCYSDAYENRIEDVKNQINSVLKDNQQQMRYDTVYGDAMDAYAEARDEALTELRDAQQEIDDGWADLEEGRQELEDGKLKLEEGRQELENGKSQLENSTKELISQEKDANARIASGQARIDDGYAQLEMGKEQLEQSAREIASGEAQIAAAREELEKQKEEAYAQIDDGLLLLKEGKAQAEAGIQQIQARIDALTSGDDSSGNQGNGTDQPSDGNGGGTDPAAILQQLNSQLAALQEQAADLDNQIAALEIQRAQAEAQFSQGEARIDAQAEELAAGWQQYEAGLAEWNTRKAQLDESQEALMEQAASGKVQFASAWERIREARQELMEAKQDLADGEQELANGEQDLLDGEKELIDGQQELDENREKAMAELADAKAEIDDIEMAKWYIQSRDSLSGYSNVENDAASIEGLATFLPLIFFVVAILISLTAITRMVEEDRGLIGTYKALGFKNSEIRRKYMVYAAGASLAGGIVGDICGFVILPKIIFIFFDVMYMIPQYYLRFQLAAGSIGIIMFMAGILIAVWFAVKTELSQMPSALMRPLVPKKGSRIFLEYIPSLWKRMSFLNKVTARNLFRYKKRLIMTVVGIMGCTGLLVCGFAIKDTVTDLMPLQYETVTHYDVLSVALENDNDKLLSYMDDSENISEYVNIQVSAVSIKNEAGDEESVQMFIIPDDCEISSFIKLADHDGNEIALADDGIMVTYSTSDVLGLEAGDTANLQDLSLNEARIPVACVTENYLGDMVYISESSYEKYFSMESAPNAVLVKLTDSCKADDPMGYAEALGAKEGIISNTSTDTLKAEFSKAFTLINLVVYVILILAAALAFVVLFTLSTTNISERCRELATIKVLGFFDREVHMYVNKETLILSVMGIILGMPAGLVLSSCLTWALKIPGLYFAVSVHKISYVICGVIAFAFALIVNQITNRLLNAIDPVEALKSVE